MRILRVYQESGKPAAGKMPIPTVSRRQQFGWWPLDIALHKDRLGSLSKTINKSGIEEQWLTYLQSLKKRDVVSPESARTAELLWHGIRKNVPKACPPNARLVVDDDMAVLMLSWNRRGAYLEITVCREGTFDWFYTDSQNSYESEDAQSLEAGSHVRLLARIQSLF